MSPRGLVSGSSGASGLGLDSDIQRRVIEDLKSNKKRGSINPRRPVPIIKQQYSKKVNNEALSPKLPECFLRQMGGATAVASQRDRNREYVSSQGADIH